MKKHTFIVASAMLIIVILSFLFFKGGEMSWNILLAVVPAGILSAGILDAHRNIVKNNCTKASAWLYGFEVIFPFIWIGVCSVVGLMPLTTLAIFLTLPIAIACAQSMKFSLTGGTGVIADLDVRTAKLQILFSILLSAAFVAGKFIS